MITYSDKTIITKTIPKPSQEEIEAYARAVRNGFELYRGSLLGLYDMPDNFSLYDAIKIAWWVERVRLFEAKYGMTLENALTIRDTYYFKCTHCHQWHCGGRLSKQEKVQWQNAAKHDGFNARWTWTCYLVRIRIKEQLREQQTSQNCQEQKK